MTVIVPCRNEREYIDAFLRSASGQQRGDLQLEFIIADGVSDDGTREHLENYVRTHPEWHVIDNPKRSVSSGLNLAVRASRHDIIVRMDVHTEYAPDYIQQCVTALQRTGADNVGGPARTRAEGYFQRAIALAYHSPFSSGGARFHDPDFEGYVDTVTYGCWWKTRLIQLGGFDEELVRNQDDELNLRIHRSGGKVYQSPAIQSWYRPRGSVVALFRQYMQYGYWKVRVIQKHQVPASWRHVVPGAFVASLVILAVLSPFSRMASLGFVAVGGSYTCANLLVSLGTCRAQVKFVPVMPVIFGAFHFGYGYGFLRGVIDFVLRHREASGSFSQLTRRSTQR